jgi:hypothetical protein
VKRCGLPWACAVLPSWLCCLQPTHCSLGHICTLPVPSIRGCYKFLAPLSSCVFTAASLLTAPLHAAPSEAACRKGLWPYNSLLGLSGLPLKSWWRLSWPHNSCLLHAYKTNITKMPRSAASGGCTWALSNHGCSGHLSALLAEYTETNPANHPGCFF